MRFLTNTAILDRFTAALCDAVTARRDAAEIIDVLERENLFLVALDESRRWFRYHHLFAKALRARLTSSEPALVPLLHRRASEWFRTQGFPEEAIGHALATGDTGVAVEVIAAQWYPYVNAGRLETVSRWLKDLGDHAIAGNPLAAHIAAWVAALSGQPGKVQRLLPVIDAGGDRGPLPDGMRSLRSSAALLRATFGFDGIRVMRESAATAVELEDDPASPWHALALTVRGFSLYLSGEPGSAEALKRAVLSGVADPAIHLTAISIAALVAIAEGRPGEGSALADAALRIADDGLGDTPQASLAYLAVAAGWAEQGRRRSPPGAAASPPIAASLAGDESLANDGDHVQARGCAAQPGRRCRGRDARHRDRRRAHLAARRGRGPADPAGTSPPSARCRPGRRAGGRRPGARPDQPRNDRPAHAQGDDGDRGDRAGTGAVLEHDQDPYPGDLPEARGVHPPRRRDQGPRARPAVNSPGRLRAPRTRPRACGHPDAASSADRNGRSAARAASAELLSHPAGLASGTTRPIGPEPVTGSPAPPGQ